MTRIEQLISDEARNKLLAITGRSGAKHGKEVMPAQSRKCLSITPTRTRA